jgi:AraC-like DNA-binding protein
MVLQVLIQYYPLKVIKIEKMINFATMKIVPFQIPKSVNESFRVQTDEVPHFYNHLHQHPEIQVTVIEKSTGILVAGNYIGRFAPGDVFVIGSNQPHVFRNDEVYFSQPMEAKSTSVFFDETSMGQPFWNIKEISGFQSFFGDSSGGYRVTGDAAAMVTTALETLPACRGVDKIIQFLHIIKALTNKKELVPLASNAAARKVDNVSGNRLKTVIEFTFRESHRNIGLKEVADIAHLTPEAFCKYFKTHTRKTYINFLNEIRINNACRLLLEEEDSINAICYRSGFNNLANFNRVFKKITGISPRDYRKL